MRLDSKAERWMKGKKVGEKRTRGELESGKMLHIRLYLIRVLSEDEESFPEVLDWNREYIQREMY